MEKHGALGNRVFDRHHHGKLPVLDADQIKRVLRQGAALRNHDRHRLADIAYPLDRETPVLHGLFDAYHERR